MTADQLGFIAIIATVIVIIAAAPWPEKPLCARAISLLRRQEQQQRGYW